MTEEQAAEQIKLLQQIANNTQYLDQQMGLMVSKLANIEAALRAANNPIPGLAQRR